jgi:alpha-mannosidase
VEVAVKIEHLEHLLDILRGRIETLSDTAIPLVWAEGGADDRAHMVGGPHADWAPVGPQTIWGAPQRYFWFAGVAEIPQELDGQAVFLRIEAQFGRVMGRSDPQCLVRIDGKIRAGADFNHRNIRLAHKAVAGQRYRIMVEAGTIEDRRQIGFGCRLIQHDPLAETVYFDLKTPLDVARCLPETDHRRDAILSRVARAINAVDLRAGNPARLAASLRAAQEIAAEIYALADTEAAPRITVTGHTHIDVAWLWRVRETRQKMARSVATALSLMEEYPDYVFMYNQGYLLDTLSLDYPALFQRFRDRHSAGQVEIEGALWLEPDANMASGECLVRHILRGVRYHQETFGVTPRLVWLPDTFGYSAALPQILKQAGIEVFITHKMSWNDTNRMPNETFFWQGIDATRLPTYFLTTQPYESTSIGTTYCPDLTASHVMGTWRRYSQKRDNDQLFLVYGHGDGGGGPTREMLEHIRRMERGIPGCPRVEHGPMGPFFDNLVARMKAAPEHWPVWDGELYLEFHRGTYTSVAEVKRNNRRAEATLREIEALATLVWLDGADYPVAEIAGLWDVLLLNQFHDILPGSSIREVYDDSREEFAAFFDEAEALTARLAARLGAVVVNPYGQARSGLVALPGPIDANEIQAQEVVHADGSTGWVASVADVPGLGAMALRADDCAAATECPTVSVTHLENAFLRAEFDTAGRMVSLFDKAMGREVLDGPANRMQAFRDLPAQFDAWDIDTSYRGQVWDIDDLVSAEVVETGPHRAAIRFEWRYERSRIVQVVSLAGRARHVEFDCWADWREQNTLVKTAFPLAIRSSETQAEIQFGHMARPTHANTSWDAARFETVMHRWVALSEPDFGLALLNDCKYGYDAQATQLRLTLLRAPTWPWDGADIGEHRFRYAAMVHHGLEEVAPEAEAFNHPLRLVGSGQGAGVAAPLTLDNPAIAVEAMKQSEDGAALILRLWERTGRRQSVRLTLAKALGQLTLADLLESPGAVVPRNDADDAAVTLAFTPFEIKTLRIERG